jgi:hypothetical protein
MPVDESQAALSRKSRIWAGLFLISIIILAAVLRLWQLQALPPGLWFDAAVNGSDVRMINSGAGFPIYFPANTGREPLFIYLQALSVAIFGARPFSLYLVSAIIGILTIPAIWWLARTLWDSKETAQGSGLHFASREVTWMALLAAAGLTVSYWHVSLSRRGLRTIMLPLVSALAVGFFWRAWTRRRYRDYVLAGIFGAAALYTYTAARLLPVALVVFVALEGLLCLVQARRLGSDARREQWAIWRRRLAGLALLGAVLAIVLLPLAITAWQQPGLLSTRIDQVALLDAPANAAPGEAVTGLANSVVATLRGFYDRGDANARTNLPGRPANDPLQAVLFTLGVAMACYYIREARSRLLLIWLGSMLLPTMLSTDAPNFVRSSGVLPPLALLYALGAAVIVRLWQRGPIYKYGVPALLAALLVVSGGLTARDYFARWPTMPRFGDGFVQVPGTAPETAAEVLAALLPTTTPEHPLLISYFQFSQPHTILALGPIAQGAPSPVLAAGGQDGAVRFALERNFDAQQPMFLIWQEDGRVKSAAVEPLTSTDAEAIRGLIDQHAAVAMVSAPGYQRDAPLIAIGALPPNARLQPRKIANPLDIKFANGLRLIGYDVDRVQVMPNANDGDGTPEFNLTLFWQLDRPDPAGTIAATNVFVHLATPQGASGSGQGIWQQANGSLKQSYLFGWVRPGEPMLLQDLRRVPVPAAMPPGKAYFEVGLYRPGSNERVGIVDGQGNVTANQVNLGAVMVGEAVQQADLNGLSPLGVQFDNRIELAGWQARLDPSDPQALKVDLGWRAINRSPTNYTAFVHLVDTGGQIIAQDDRAPGGTENATTQWVPGESLRTTFTLKLPPGISPRGLRLRVGLYEPDSGKQLPVTATPDQMSPAATYILIPLPK